MANGNKMDGTPKTLDEAIALALMVGPLSEIRERAYLVLKDYLSQKFGVAMLMHTECDTVLKNLFEDITRRK